MSEDSSDTWGFDLVEIEDNPKPIAFIVSGSDHQTLSSESTITRNLGSINKYFWPTYGNRTILSVPTSTAMAIESENHSKKGRKILEGENYDEADILATEMEFKTTEMFHRIRGSDANLADFPTTPKCSIAENDSLEDLRRCIASLQEDIEIFDFET